MIFKKKDDLPGLSDEEKLRIKDLEIKEAEEELKKEKAKYDFIKSLDEKENKKKQIKKQLNEYKKQNNPTYKKLKNFGDTADKMLTNIEINNQKANSGVVEGETVIIINGIYTSKEMKISKFINGGIEGLINGNIVKIRHGSYRKV